MAILVLKSLGGVLRRVFAPPQNMRLPRRQKRLRPPRNDRSEAGVIVFTLSLRGRETAVAILVLKSLGGVLRRVFAPPQNMRLPHRQKRLRPPRNDRSEAGVIVFTLSLAMTTGFYFSSRGCAFVFRSRGELIL